MEEKIEHKVNQVKAIPALSGICLSVKKAPECIIYYLLKNYSVSLGGGPAIEEQLVFDYLKKCGWSKPSVSRLLKKGNTIFWNRTVSHNDIKYVRLIGWADVCVYFKISFKAVQLVYLINKKDLIPGAYGRSWLYASYLSPYNGKLRSRALIEQETGCCPHTQIKFENITGVKIIPNYVKDDDNDPQNGNKPNQRPNQFFTPLLKSRIAVLKDAAGKFFAVSNREGTIQKFAPINFWTRCDLEEYLKTKPNNVRYIVFVSLLKRCLTGVPKITDLSWMQGMGRLWERVEIINFKPIYNI